MIARLIWRRFLTDVAHQRSLGASSPECDFASTNRRPSRPEIRHVLAMSQFGVGVLLSPSASHQSLNWRRTCSGSRGNPPSGDALSSWASRMQAVPCGCHRSWAETTTSGLPTVSVSRRPTSSLAPSQTSTQRGRLPRSFFPSLFNQSILALLVSMSASASPHHPSGTQPVGLGELV